ncbi:hypothetical protein HPB51_028662 [Rhipicephalus microplus]|uniref:C2H2-type domain-containing protein n=1 Tax=Rhipicephalus microplus TaxID=6941 RepID=A0A9J6CWR0_RHIMP|nr:hypothetical protein HPB51_028662 [Rhipicephalus microplus]
MAIVMRVIPVGPLLDVGALSSASREAYHSLVSVRGDLHSCRQCSYATKNKALMQRHLFKHTGERPFQCHLCPAAFARKTNLKTHIRTHTGERPFSCDCCSASFTRQNTLMEHMLTHTGERPFFCDQCSVSFSQRGSLIRHMRTHTGERPFYCCHCNASFSRKHHLGTGRARDTHQLLKRCSSTRTLSASHKSTGTLPSPLQGTHSGVPLTCKPCLHICICVNKLFVSSRSLATVLPSPAQG